MPYVPGMLVCMYLVVPSVLLCWSVVEAGQERILRKQYSMDCIVLDNPMGQIEASTYIAGSNHLFNKKLTPPTNRSLRE